MTKQIVLKKERVNIMIYLEVLEEKILFKNFSRYYYVADKKVNYLPSVYVNK